MLRVGEHARSLPGLADLALFHDDDAVRTVTCHGKIVGDELSVRFTPTLSFELDTVPEASAHMEDVLARARARDAELAKLKEGAKPAGDANPYKTSDEEED